MSRAIVGFVENMGRGLFAYGEIFKGETIDNVEVIEFPIRENKIIHQTILDNYVYELNTKKIGLALGIGSLFNHSDEPNVDYEVLRIAGRYIIIYSAKRAISDGEHLTIDYGYDPITLKKKRKK